MSCTIPSGVGSATSGLRGGQAQDLRALVRTLKIIDLDGDPFILALPGALRSVFDGLWVTFRVRANELGWAMDFVHGSGPGVLGVRAEKAWRDLITAAPARFTTFDPLRPAAEERNMVLDSSDAAWVARGQQAYAYQAYRWLGIDRLSQARTLLCDGPMLLAWLGGFRGEPFRPAEIEAFR